VNKLVGWVMKRSRGRADAKAVRKVLEGMKLS
jgi:Asp-tRNA(Asn)/Glu-tRNA(Gln) amidotransferase B subunit